MEARFLLRPAGCGKTFRCLTEIRATLAGSQTGPPLLLVAPRQTTYQLERQLLADPSLPGYSRLHILSFERLAGWVFQRLGLQAPPMLDEQGRVMVLRSLLGAKRKELKLFRASARLNGFAQQLSLLLSELQRHQQTPESLNQLAAQLGNAEALAHKLQDLATLLEAYLDWLRARGLEDADRLLGAATEALTGEAHAQGEITQHAARSTPRASLSIAGLWVDGFAEFSAQELDLLAALVPHCERATVTFCLERPPSNKTSWLSNWWVGARAFEQCRQRLERLPGVLTVADSLDARPAENRFASRPELRHLERFWAEPQPFKAGQGSRLAPDSVAAQSWLATAALPGRRDACPALRLVQCADPEAEATFAAREILRHVRAGGRFRETTVLVRSLAAYHAPLQRVFARYEIPFFLDRREPVMHHPLAELTRSALRALAMGWQHEDWFAALKTGLVPAGDEEIDLLENEALARGWRGAVWRQRLELREAAKSPGDEARLKQLESRLERLRQRLVAPFERLFKALGLEDRQHRPTGPQLAGALREFWRTLDVERQLQDWAAAETPGVESRLPGAVHTTVWDQVNAWLENVELAFPQESLPLSEWLPILEAGLGNLSVGLIPPALDQVLVGAIDRSRNPDIKLAFVLGLNEGVFPAPIEANVLLSEADRAELEGRNVSVSSTARQHLARERFYAYLAFTRARERLILTCAQQDANGSPVNPSPLLVQVRQLFPALELETFPPTLDWRESEHAVELVGTLLRMRNAECGVRSEECGVRSEEQTEQSRVEPEGHAPRNTQDVSRFTFHVSHGTHHASRVTPAITLPSLAAILDQLGHFQSLSLDDALTQELAARLYGPVLRTSVSRMEQFAACPFKFFVHSGLRAEERKRYELDPRELGSFQHDALALFHAELSKQGRRWRDLTPAKAREFMGIVATRLIAGYRAGIFRVNEQGQFMARVVIESLQDFIETIVGWMRSQYLFDPVEVELPFGEDQASPAWSIALPGGQQLDLAGRIDRVDLHRQPGGTEALCVVVDYKSGQKQLDPLLLANGLQLQLLAYLNVLRRWPNPLGRFGVERVLPGGVFYVSLRGQYDRAPNRDEALRDAGEARKSAYFHTGRFDIGALPQLDARPGAMVGDQFNYRRNRDGEISRNCREPLPREEFMALLDSIETNLRDMGREVFAGRADVSPFRKSATTACDLCEYQSICRIDPWTHRFRVLRQKGAEPR